MTTIATRRPSVGILGPPVLWSLHFLLVYSYVSLACIWGWGAVTWLGVGVIEWGVALATVVIGAAIAALGLLAWRDRGDPPGDMPQDRQHFLAWVAAWSGGLFLAATLLVGLPTLARPSCY